MPCFRSLHHSRLENAKVDQRFWEGLRRVHTDTIEGDKGVIGAAERAIANSEASAANAAVHAKAAKERIDRIERGETSVERPRQVADAQRS